jgi:F-type H+-transporting ATPase subunit alpha
MNCGKDVLIVFDNLTRHAWIYRQISLLLERPPGREAYPGDIFYVHSQLIERGAKLSDEKGGGSMTLLPIVETQEGDVAGLICSNLVSMTDGQIYLNTGLFNEGFRPAIDLGLSVSRIGSKVQSEAIKEVSKTLKWGYVQYRELLSITKVKTKLSPEVENIFKKGTALEELFIQAKNNPVSLVEVIVLFYVFNKQIPAILEKEVIRRFKKEFYKYILGVNPQLIEDIRVQKVISVEIKDSLDKCIEEWLESQK